MQFGEVSTIEPTWHPVTGLSRPRKLGMSLGGRPPKDQSREASDMGCGRGIGEDKTRSTATCTEGRGCKGSFFSRNVVFYKIFKISRFLPTADTHTSTSLHEASRETQEQGSNLWACHRRTSLELLRRPQQQWLQWLRACTRRSTGTLQPSPYSWMSRWYYYQLYS